MTDATAWVAIVGSVTTLLGGLGGYWLAGRNEEARDRRAAQREARARSATLRERLEEQRNTSQLDAMLALQDDLFNLVRAAALTNRNDWKNLRDHGEFGRNSESTESDQQAATRSVHRLRSRILDSSLREMVREFVELCNQDAFILGKIHSSSVPEMIDQLERQFANISPAYNRLTEYLGEHIRSEVNRGFDHEGDGAA